MSDSKSIRVLLLAEAANPEWRSVPLVGWSHCQAISEVVDAHLVTQVRNREAILRFGLREPNDFTSINSEAIAYPFYVASSLLRGGSGKGWTTVQAFATFSYYYFEYLAWKKFKRELKAGRYDIVHRVTPMSPTNPSPMAKWCHSIGVPFVLGPLNGGLPWPPEFPHLAKQENEWLAPLRGIYRYLPYQKSTLRCSDAILAGSGNVFKTYSANAADKTFYMSENGLDFSRFERRRDGTRSARLPLRILHVGRMVPYKGADILIESMTPLIRAGKVLLTLIGDGPHKAELIRLANQNSLHEGIQFLDSVPHQELAKYYSQADIFGFPSLRELGGAVVIEAMIQGVVPIVVNYGGPPEFLTEQSGIALPLGNRAQIVESMRNTVEQLIDHPERLARMSTCAAEEAQEKFSWKQKAKDDLQVYRWLLKRGPRPDLMPPASFSLGHSNILRFDANSDDSELSERRYRSSSNFKSNPMVNQQ